MPINTLIENGMRSLLLVVIIGLATYAVTASVESTILVSGCLIAFLGILAIEQLSHRAVKITANAIRTYSNLLPKPLSTPSTTDETDTENNVTVEQ